MKLQIFMDEHEVATESELHHFLEQRRGNLGVFWWMTDDNKPAIGLFLNGDRACLFDGTTGDWSNNPDYDGESEDTVDFMIGNGQMDKFPAYSVVSSVSAIDAFVYYYRAGERSKSIVWQ